MDTVKYIETQNKKIATYQGLSVSVDRFNGAKSVALSLENLNRFSEPIGVIFRIVDNYLSDSKEIYFLKDEKLRYSSLEGVEQAISFLELNHKAIQAGGLIVLLEKNFREFAPAWAELRAQVLSDAKIQKLLQVIAAQNQ